ncbi:hypothetical protein [Kineococcus sp. SYSU DK003]|uniref:hypothetical protein n=1 Tax=Kineococcus sp. SYSU DK003 TaxID=3383124 RepID=UPI003D7D74FC
MRWDDLFDDLAGQIEHAGRMDRAEEVADRIRREEATVGLVDRVRAATSPLTFVLRDGSALAGTPVDAGPGWVLLVEAVTGRQVLVPTEAVAAVRGLPPHSAAPLGVVAARRTFLVALRALAGASARVTVRTTASDLHGALGRVGADHVDVRVEGAAPEGTAVQTVPFGAVLVVLERG